MASYADELSLLLTARDEMSSRLKDVRSNLKSTERQLVAARREFENTGAPEAAKEYERLAKEHERLSGTQKELARSLSASKKKMSEFSSESDKSSKSMGRLSTSMEKHAKSIQRTGLVVGAAMVLMAKKSLSAFADAEKQQAQLELTYKKFPRVADVTIESMRKMNDAIMNKTGADNDSLAASEAVLGRFKMTGTEIMRLMPLVNDYAIATGKEVPVAAESIGKALMGNARAMKSLGIDFKKTGNHSKDLGAIMDGLKKKVGGAGAAFGQTVAGQVKIANENFTEMQEEVGALLVPALRSMVDIVKPIVSWFRSLSPQTQKVAMGIALLGTAAMIATPRILAMRAAIMSASGGMGIFATAGRLLSGLVSPLGLVTLGVTAGAFAWSKYNEAQANAQADADSLRGTLNKLTGAATKSTKAVIAQKLASTMSTAEITALGSVGITTSGMANAIVRGGRTMANLQNRMTVAKQYGIATGNSAITGGLSTTQKEMGFQGSALATAQADKNASDQKRAALAKAGSGATLSIADMKAVIGDVKIDPTSLDKAKLTTNDPTAQKTLALIETNSRNTANALKATGTMPLSTLAQSGTAPVPSFAPKVKKAAGGSVFGPGSGTSDSIPAMLSNGEFVLRERAARAIGYGTLDKMNKSGQIPYVPALSSSKSGVVQMPVVGRDAPLVGHMTVEAHSQVDVELALARTARMQERDQRTRYAGSRAR